MDFTTYLAVKCWTQYTITYQRGIILLKDRCILKRYLLPSWKGEKKLYLYTIDLKKYQLLLEIFKDLI